MEQPPTCSSQTRSPSLPNQHAQSSSSHLYCCCWCEGGYFAGNHWVTNTTTCLNSPTPWSSLVPRSGVSPTDLHVLGWHPAWYLCPSLRLAASHSLQKVDFGWPTSRKHFFLSYLILVGLDLWLFSQLSHLARPAAGLMTHGNPQKWNRRRTGLPPSAVWDQLFAKSHPNEKRGTEQLIYLPHSPLCLHFTIQKYEKIFCWRLPQNRGSLCTWVNF